MEVGGAPESPSPQLAQWFCILAEYQNYLGSSLKYWCLGVLSKGWHFLQAPWEDLMSSPSWEAWEWPRPFSSLVEYFGPGHLGYKKIEMRWASELLLMADSSHWVGQLYLSLYCTRKMVGLYDPRGQPPTQVSCLSSHHMVLLPHDNLMNIYGIFSYARCWAGQFREEKDMVLILKEFNNNLHQGSKYNSMEISFLHINSSY